MNFGNFNGGMPDPENIKKFLDGVKDAFARAAADTRASAAQPHLVSAQKALGIIAEFAENAINKGKKPGPMEIMSMMGIAQNLEGSFRKIASLAETDTGVQAVIADLAEEIKELTADLGIDIPNIPGMPSMPKGPARPPATPKSNDNDNKNKKPPSTKGGKFKL